jgi:hypothetical protein
MFHKKAFFKWPRFGLLFNPSIFQPERRGGELSGHPTSPGPSEVHVPDLRPGELFSVVQLDPSLQVFSAFIYEC